MVRPLVEFALVALLGIALLLNPVYLYPDGGGNVRHYEATPIDENNAYHALRASDRALECSTWQRRICKLEADVLAAGTLSYDVGVLRGGALNGSPTWSDDRPYDAVRLEANWYVPEREVENGTADLSLRRVSEQGAARAVARDASSFSPAVRTVIERGSLDVQREIDGVNGSGSGVLGDSAIVTADGTTYLVTHRGTSYHWSTDLPGIRVGLIAVGVVLVLGAGYRLHRRTIEYWP